MEHSPNRQKVRFKFEALSMKTKLYINRLLKNKLIQNISPLLLLFTANSYATAEVGFFVSDYRYEETYDGNFLMDDKATMLGVRAAASTYKRELTWKVDGSFQYGNMRYTSKDTGTMKGSDDFIAELRGTVSETFLLASNAILMPYVGLGYQYLVDDAQNMKTSTGHYGYLRMQSYLYVPVGIEMNNIQLNPEWSMAVKLEYDLFLRGNNSTDLSSLGKPTFKFKQNNGGGLRASLRFTTQQFAVEPFIKYWKVERSNSVIFYDNNNGKRYEFFEPDNTTTEFGVSFIYAFN